jgi:hypothetical protein
MAKKKPITKPPKPEISPRTIIKSYVQLYQTRYMNAQDIYTGIPLKGKDKTDWITTQTKQAEWTKKHNYLQP